MSMSIAIVGGGPRALWAVEEVTAVARERGVAVPAIDVFDDPAHGGPYDIWQPEYWRVNVRSSVIRTHRGTFDEWRRERGEAEPLDEFPPRALVGTFVADAWAQQTHVTWRDEIVTSIEPGPAGSWVIGDRSYDEVLLVTGHHISWPQALTGENVVQPYPLCQLQKIQAGQSVAVRGASLTFIDTVLALTEGRGGRFEEKDGALEYIASGEEPAVIWPVTRSGRLMVVKPEPPTSAQMVQVIAPARDRVLAVESLDELQAVLAQVAQQLAPGATDIPAVLTGSDAVTPETELAALRGEHSARTAVGRAFRELYPEIVERFSFGGHETLQGWKEFAQRMERLAFGPPPVNAQRLLALIDAGLVSLEYVGAGEAPEADVLVDAVLAPPNVLAGTLESKLVDAGIARLAPGTQAFHVKHDGTLVGQESIAAVGRVTEGYVLGNDTLSRTLHDVIPRWARRVVDKHAHVHPDLHGTPPLTARLEPWMEELIANPKAAQEALDTYGSPVNVLDTQAFSRNAQELISAGESHGVDVRVFFARKANKAMAFVDTARNEELGVDVASYRELEQVLAAEVPGERIILSAAIKPDELLRLAVDNGVVVSVDSVPELQRIARIAEDTPAFIAPRVAPRPDTLPATRFGELATTWVNALREPIPGITIVGVHAHLHGYAAADRITAARQACELIDALTPTHPNITFIDLGGGVPMSYLDNEDQWQNYLELRDAMRAGDTRPFTWKSDPLTTTYPYYQQPVRGEWLSQILQEIGPDLQSRNLRLHLEPGRSLLDGCGMTLMEVAFTKTRSDGLPLVGVGANRTQVRTTSDDYLVDPLLIRTQEAPGEELEGYLVGAYCIEDEVILRRRLRFPQGVRAGDIIAIPNTAGYFMHILESASHQIPLARNVVRSADGRVVPDRIDGA